MAFINVKNVRVAGMAAGVPRMVMDNLNASRRFSEEYDNATFVEQTGVKERRIDNSITASDLCFAAAEDLLTRLGWDRNEVGALIFVTQTPDFIAPATACVLQDKLGLPKECLAFDIELGCSGWVYGLSVVSSLMQGGSIKKALLLAGDGRNNYEGSEKYVGALFGYATTVTALEYKKGYDGMKFHLGSDGSGWDALYVKEGGTRYPVNKDSLNEVIEDGKPYTGFTSRMKGMDVFSFAISTAPKSVKKLAKEFDFDYTDADYLVLHQANKQINQVISKKLKFEETKVPESMSLFGNTSSASVPLTIVTQLGDIISKGKHKLLCCGFGIGLSWGTVWLETDDVVVSPLIEVESGQNIL